MSENRSASRASGPPELPSDAKAATLGVAFFDFSRLAEWASSQQDEQVASFLQQFYRLAHERLAAGGARIVKLMGDAGLVVFDVERAEQAILALCELSGDGRRLALEHGLDAWLNVNVHVGPVIEGSFGPAGLERYDVIGKTVNVAARLGRRGVTLSPQAFRTLGPQGRERFEKIMQPITYRLRQG